MPGGKQIEKVNILLKKLEKFGISVPTATRARKIGETAASTLPQQKQSLISTQLSHTPATAAKYYKAIRSIDKVANLQSSVVAFPATFPKLSSHVTVLFSSFIGCKLC